MFDYDDTEAAHLSEIYDGCDVREREPLTKRERANYVDARSNCFKKEDVGKFVVVQEPRRNISVVSKLYLVDRNKTKRYWWTPAAIFALVFNKKDAAETQAKKYKYNKAKVVKITKAMANLNFYLEEYVYSK